VSAARLRNLLSAQTPETQATFGRTAATVNAHSSLRWPGATEALPYRRTRRSALVDFSGPSLVVLRLRALFGVGARAEAVRAFIADPAARLSAADAAAEAGYTKRNMAEALEALRMSGLLEAYAVRNQRLYGLADAAWLSALPGSLPESYPRWSSVFRILGGFAAGLRRTESLTSRAQTAEASDVLHDLRSDLTNVGVRLSEAEQGPEAYAALQRLAADLSHEWAGGSFPATT